MMGGQSPWPGGRRRWGIGSDGSDCVDVVESYEMLIFTMHLLRLQC